MQAGDGARRWFKRIGWLVIFWALGVAALGVVALFLKAVMRLVGF